jgi:hypothetical protein
LPRRDAAVKGTISDFPKAEYFCVQDWTADSALNCLMNFDFSRMRFLQDFARDRARLSAAIARRANHRLDEEISATALPTRPLPANFG